MKTPERFFDEINNVQLTHQEVIKKLSNFQKESWNEAIKVAAENAKTTRKFQSADGSHVYFDSEVDKKSILKLKK